MKNDFLFRHRLMEIDNHILSLSMEFERYNIIINEHEMHKAKNIHDRSYGRKPRKSANSGKKSAKSRQTVEQASESTEPDMEDTESDKEAAYEGDKEESGFEDNGSATNEDEDEDEDGKKRCNFRRENSNFYF